MPRKITFLCCNRALYIVNVFCPTGEGNNCVWFGVSEAWFGVSEAWTTCDIPNQTQLIDSALWSISCYEMFAVSGRPQNQDVLKLFGGKLHMDDVRCSGWSVTSCAGVLQVIVFRLQWYTICCLIFYSQHSFYTLPLFPNAISRQPV